MAAAWSVRAVAVADAAHLAVIAWIAPPEKLMRQGPGLPMAMVGFHVAVVAVLVWLGQRLSTGRNAAVAVGVTGVFGFMMFLGTAIGAAKGHPGGWPLITAQVALGMACVVAIVCTARAWTAR